MERTEYISKSPSETWDIGERIGKEAKRGDLYAIYGELGTGKTQLVKGIARGLGIQDWQYVASPSFTIMNVYEGDLTLCHVDLYRLEGYDIESLNIEEYLEEGIVAVEWAERGAWWNGAVKVYIDAVSEGERRITITKT
ncbi:MAG TPA: tRNA (adenosine(37)-N6)-threonylcarbamoyltransferase complex ATPase subunit type 1 TsaE [Syntrophorhabdaceae bacterium]|nr:tRNA (adenosine(37)-N6)-threonylcarbamoyltransferase complex ATPase subunit type 1 TsaE [Syntrophorhabdaceae bacterium]HNT69288.1 tRNA (adenosine(37)-N6)-threonylcarbamoyltransferase complex ATPase subunit type 1 TsaE [Syntrophorhabdaceae bacterium]